MAIDGSDDDGNGCWYCCFVCLFVCVFACLPPIASNKSLDVQQQLMQHEIGVVLKSFKWICFFKLF